jgi:hypothetical protein
MSDDGFEPDRISQYNQLANEEAGRLDAALTGIRASQDSGELSVRQAADARVAVLEEHLNRLRLLRDEYLGGSG